MGTLGSKYILYRYMEPLGEARRAIQLGRYAYGLFSKFRVPFIRVP